MIEAAVEFLKKSLLTLKDNELDLKYWEIDHLCYRTSTEENYHKIKNKFLELGELLIESMVNGRMIATIKLHRPIVYGHYRIDLIEIPSPKKDSNYEEGYEHLEIVIDCYFEELIDQYLHLNFKLPKSQSTLNPEMKLKFDGFQVKFHHKSLEHIINIEKNERIISFLEKSLFFENFSDFSPCLSGTLPLDIATPSSDLDILFQVEDFEKFLSIVKEHYGNCPQFSYKTKLHQNKDSLIINFNYDGLPLEFFAQDFPVFKQSSNLHFLVEGKLLKLLGKSFKENVVKLKNEGVKTEPAIASLLGLDNPYEDLEKLSFQNDRELHSSYIP